MANIIGVTELLLNESLRRIDVNSVILKKVKKNLSDKLTNEVGDYVDIPKSIYAVVGSGDNIEAGPGEITDIIQGKTRLELTEHKHVAYRLKRRELAHHVRQSTIENYSKAAATALMQSVESKFFQVAKDAAYQLLNPLTPTAGPTNQLRIAQIEAAMDEAGIPSNTEERCGMISPNVMAVLSDTVSKLFTVVESRRALNKGYVAEVSGFELYKSTNAPNHTNGRHTTLATPVINGAAQNVTYDSVDTGRDSQPLVTDGWDAGLSTLTKGSNFTIDGVFAVKGNPEHEVLPELRVFVVNADITSSGGAMTPDISPAIITSGPYQTVSAAPADGAAINMVGDELVTTRQSIWMHDNALACAFGRFSDPISDAVTTSTDSIDGLMLTVSHYSNGSDMTETFRWDILFGVIVQNPHFLFRYSGV